MTRLLERLEHVLGPRPRRTTAAPLHRLDRTATALSPAAPAAASPCVSPTPTVATGTTYPSTGFRDCRGEWHAWEDAS